MNISHHHPFQKLCYIRQYGDIGLLLAATGPNILSLDLQNGGVLSRWPNDLSQSAERNGDLNSRFMDDDPPTKRRKLSPSQQQEEERQDSRESSISIEFVSERAKGQRRKRKKIVNSALPNVSQVICTVDGRHIIAVTAEDKCIRVLELDVLGRLNLLSER